jgi:hypothetical protein
MSNNNITDFSTYDPSSLVFADLKRNTSGGKTIYIRCTNDAPAVFELPGMRIPFGLSSYTDANTNKTSYSVDVSMDDPSVHEFFTKIEQTVLDHVVKHSGEFLGKVYSKEVAESALFKSGIRHGKEPGKYPPTLKLKVLTGRNGEFVPKAYVPGKPKPREIPFDSIEKGQTVRTIVDVNQIWIVDNKFGITIRLKQLLALPSMNMNECAFSNVEGDDDDEIENVVDE